MARKANIAREEIHQACWELIEKNSFPNIPRLTEYFLQKDGRRCSNTTFLNAITDWEETYKDGWGPNAKMLTTTAKRKSTVQTDYWSKNKVSDLPWREKLQLEY